MARLGKQAGTSAEAPDSLALARLGIGSRLQANLGHTAEISRPPPKEAGCGSGSDHCNDG
jgi:hypothetical protein